MDNQAFLLSVENFTSQDRFSCSPSTIFNASPFFYCCNGIVVSFCDTYHLIITYIQVYINYALFVLLNIEAWVYIASNKSQFLQDIKCFLRVFSCCLKKAIDTHMWIDSTIFSHDWHALRTLHINFFFQIPIKKAVSTLTILAKYSKWITIRSRIQKVMSLSTGEYARKMESGQRGNDKQKTESPKTSKASNDTW